MPVSPPAGRFQRDNAERFVRAENDELERVLAPRRASRGARGASDAGTGLAGPLRHPQSLRGLRFGDFIAQIGERVRFAVRLRAECGADSGPQVCRYQAFVDERGMEPEDFGGQVREVIDQAGNGCLALGRPGLGRVR